MMLKDLPVGKSGRVTRVRGEGAFRRRLLDMGITPGIILTLRKTAPFGDPVEIKLRNYILTLRLEDAEEIEVIEVDK